MDRSKMRGNKAAQTSVTPVRDWWAIARGVMHAFSEHDMTTVAAAISFLALFGMFSMVSAFVAFYGLYSDPQTVVSDMRQLQGFAPSDVVINMIGQMHSVSTSSTATLVSAGAFSLAVGIWCAQQGVSSLMIALNTAYRENMTDGPLRHLLKSLFISIEVIVGLVVATLLAIGLPLYMQIMGKSIWFAECIRAVGMVLAGVLLFFGLAALYRWVPDREPPRWRWASAGAALVVGFWTVASILFSVFLAYSNSYVAMYGSLSGVVLLLTLTYVTVVTVLVGAVFNAHLEYLTAADTTIDEAAPMGERGAYVADHIAGAEARARVSKNK